MPIAAEDVLFAEIGHPLVGQLQNEGAILGIIAGACDLTKVSQSESHFIGASIDSLLWYSSPSPCFVSLCLVFGPSDASRMVLLEL